RRSRPRGPPLRRRRDQPSPFRFGLSPDRGRVSRAAPVRRRARPEAGADLDLRRRRVMGATVTRPEFQRTTARPAERLSPDYGLMPVMASVLRVIIEAVDTTGIPPTYREIVERTELRSISRIHYI